MNINQLYLWKTLLLNFYQISKYHLSKYVLEEVPGIRKPIGSCHHLDVVDTVWTFF